MPQSAWNWLGVKDGASESVQAARAPSLEQLEPRLLLSADLMGTEPLAPLASSLSEQAIFVNLDRKEEPTKESDGSLILTYLASANETNLSQAGASDNSGAGGDYNSTEPPLGQVESEVQVADESDEPATPIGNEPAGRMVSDWQDSTLGPEATPVKIRGPPVTNSVVNASQISLYSTSSQSYESAKVDSASVCAEHTAPNLPGLQLVDPNVSNWQGQITHLDFDGEQNTAYHGSVTAGSFDVPAFQAPANQAQYEEVAIEHLSTKAEDTFAGSGSSFTTQSSPGIKYSAVNGDNSAFASCALILDLTEQVDADSRDPMDAALDFIGQTARLTADTGYLSRLADIIARDTGYSVGFLRNNGIKRVLQSLRLSTAAVLCDGDNNLFSSHDRLNWDGDIVPRAANDAVISHFGSDLMVTYSGTSGARVIRSTTNGEVLMLFDGSFAISGEARKFWLSFCAPFSPPPRLLLLVLRGLSQNSSQYQLDKVEVGAHFMPFYGLKNAGENPGNT